MGETRVNLKHLLEDIRDTYPFPIEEVIITELVANALDSGAAHVDFSTKPKEKLLIVVDDGKGMTPSQFDRYHDIAASTKERGRGIGFAGIGAKLALLLAGELITETRAGRTQGATLWRLEDEQRAPWETIKPQGISDYPRGTSVTLALDGPSRLTDGRYVERVLQTHFLPLLDPAFSPIVQALYPNGVAFTINRRAVEANPLAGITASRTFTVHRGSNAKAAGFGVIHRSAADLPESQYGIGISAYGKVIMRGWEWLGVIPEHRERLSGTVEVPALAEILTTNKADFLKDGSSLKKYYRHRKAIQQAIEPILREFGESALTHERAVGNVRALDRQVTLVLTHMLLDYPEIAPLVGRRAARAPEFDFGIDAIAHEPSSHSDPAGADGEPPIIEAPEPVPAPATETPGGSIPVAGMAAAAHSGNGADALPRRSGAGLMIGFEDAADRSELGWLVESTIWINRAHPAYQKAVSLGHESYHTMLSVMWVLLGHLGEQHSAQQFISQFLSGWGSQAV